MGVAVRAVPVAGTGQSIAEWVAMRPEPLLPEAAVPPLLIIVVSVAIVVFIQWRFLTVGRPRRDRTRDRGAARRRDGLVAALLLASGLLLVGPVFSAVAVAAGKDVYVRGGLIQIGLGLLLSIALLCLARRQHLRNEPALPS